MTFRGMVTVTCAAALAAGAAGAVASSSGDEDRNYGGYISSYGKTFATVNASDGQTLVLFGRGKPKSKALTGLAAGERVVGIDVRPSTGVLYGVSSASRVFQINPTTGATSAFQTLSVTLSGASFGVDFNPSVDRLRIVSDADQNLRANVDTGATLLDTPLAYPAGDRNAGKDPAVTAVGYTYAPFNVAPTPPAPTALYDVDGSTDAFTLQNPPNGGGLQSIGPVKTDVGLAAGFDIAGKVEFQAFGLYQQAGKATLYAHEFDRNGAVAPTGISLTGSYDGLAVLNAYAK